MARRLATLAGCAACTVALLAGGCSAAEERGGARGTVGYTVTAPAGWEDITRQVEEDSGAGLDVAYGGPKAGGARMNVNIARRDAGSGASLERLVRDGRAEVDELGGGKIDFTPDVRTEIDGAPALRYDFRTNGNTVRQVGAVHEGGFYVVTLTAPTPAFRKGVAKLEGMLRSWQWD